MHTTALKLEPAVQSAHATKLQAAPSDQKTICQLVLSLDVGGAEVLAAELAQKLSPRYRFVFACLDECGCLGDQLIADGFQVEILDRSPGIDWRCARRLAKFLRREQVDLLHAHQYTPFFQGLLAGLGARRPPMLFTEHGRHYPDLSSWKRTVCNRLLLGRKDRVVGVGHAVRRALIDNEGMPKDRVNVVYNGVDPAPYLETTWQDRAAVRKELNFSDDDLLILHVARLHPLKDHETSLRACERVRQKHPSARLILAGDGPEQTSLQRYVHDRRLDDAVRFLGMRRDIPQLLSAADVFLLTSISEGIPLTVIEAMASALPIVATDVGGLGEMVEEGITGFLAPAGNDSALAEHMERLFDDPELRREVGAAARHTAVSRFSQERMHAAYCDLYEEMLHG